jgi:fatty acid synthase
VIIAFETGFVPPNINFTSPRNDINALMDGTICVVTEEMPLKNGYIGINSFGFGGANAHMLLQWNIKKKINNGALTDDLPRLVVLSGTTEESVKLFLNDVSNCFNSTNITFSSREHYITYAINTFIFKTFILYMCIDC